MKDNSEEMFPLVDEEGNTVEGTLEWKDGTQRPDTSVTSAEWIFMPSSQTNYAQFL